MDVAKSDDGEKAKKKILMSLPKDTATLLRHVAAEEDKDPCEIVNRLIVTAFAGRTFTPMVSAAS